MKKEYVFDVSTDAVVKKAVVRVEADDFESAEMFRDQEIGSGEGFHIDWMPFCAGQAARTREHKA